MELSKITEYENQFPKGAIIDGVVDGEKYFNSYPRIAWFLKEAYTTEEEGWHIRKYYGSPDAYEKFFKTARTTWPSIIYSSYGIINGFQKWNDMPYIRNKPEMCEVVESLAIINANKLPSKTGTYTTWPNLNQGFEEFKPLIQRQIEILQPQIHIFGSTFYLYKDLFGLTDEHRIEVNQDFEHCYVYIKDGKLFLDVYHPGNRTQQKDKYVNQIVDATKFWKTLIP